VEDEEDQFGNRGLVVRAAVDGQVFSVCRVSVLATSEQDSLATGVMSDCIGDR
jgi:hypothetical protein